MHDIITIGSALVDIFITSDQFKLQKTKDGLMLCEMLGDKIEVEGFNFQTGGAGSNSAVGFARMGFKTAVICETGKDVLADLVIQELEAEGVDTSLVVKEKKEQTGLSVVLFTRGGGRTILVHRGAAAELDPKDVPSRELARTKWVHLTNTAGRLETLRKIFEVVSNNKVGLSWNPGKADIKLLLNGKLSLAKIPATLFFVNKQEWQLLESLQDQLKDKISQVIVTDGKSGGTVYYPDGKVEKYQIAQVAAKEETGAGDSFAVGYVTGHLMKKNIAFCIECAKKNAASVVQQIGAKKGLLTRKDLE